MRPCNQRSTKVPAALSALLSSAVHVRVRREKQLQWVLYWTTIVPKDSNWQISFTNSCGEPSTHLMRSAQIVQVPACACVFALCMPIIVLKQLAISNCLCNWFYALFARVYACVRFSFSLRRTYIVNVVNIVAVFGLNCGEKMQLLHSRKWSVAPPKAENDEIRVH